MRNCLRIIISTSSFSWNRRFPQLLLRRPKQMRVNATLCAASYEGRMQCLVNMWVACSGRASYRKRLAYGKVVPRCLVLFGGLRSDHEDNTLLMAREGTTFPQSSRDDHTLKSGRHLSNVVGQWLINTWQVWTSPEIGICSEHKQQWQTYNFMHSQLDTDMKTWNCRSWYRVALWCVVNSVSKEHTLNMEAFSFSETLLTTV